MKECIERAAAMEAILGLTIVDPAVAQYANAVCYHLQNLPAADVAQVKHAKKERSAISKTGLICTACFSDVDADACFCKYCGARMDEEAEHGS